MHKSLTFRALLFILGLLWVEAAAPAAGLGQSQWERTVSEAKKEGEILVYLNAPSPQVRPALTEAMSEKFGLKVNVTVGTGPELSQKIISEYKAGIYQADVSFQGCSTLLRLVKAEGFLAPLKSYLILPEVKDTKSWLGGSLTYDEDGTAVRFLALALSPIVYNTAEIKQPITSYQDLLRPEWKGKIVMHDPSVLGAGANGISYLSSRWGFDKAKEFLTSLIKTQGAAVSRDYRQQVEWVARGKYSVGLWPNPGVVGQFIKTGATVGSVHLKEGAVVSPAFGCLGVPSKPAHPNATAVLLNWFLSREGQSVAVKAYGLPSARLDVAPEGVPDAFVITPGMNVYIEGEEFNKVQTKWLPGWKSIVEGGKN